MIKNAITESWMYELGITGDDVMIFSLIYTNSKATADDIAKFMHKRRDNTLRNIDNLKSKSLIVERNHKLCVSPNVLVEHEDDTPSNGALFEVSSKKIKKQQNKPTINTYREVIRVWVNQYFADVDGHEELEANLITWINQYQPKHRGTYSPDALNGELMDFMEHHQRDMKRMLEKSKELSRHGNYQMLPSWEKNQNFRSFKKGVENISDYGMDVGVFDHV